MSPAGSSPKERFSDRVDDYVRYRPRYSHEIITALQHACGLTPRHVIVDVGCGTGLLAKIKPAVEATSYSGERSASNYSFVDAVARKNVEMTMANIRKGSPVLAELETNATIKIAGAMYNLETGAVEFLA